MREEYLNYTLKYAISILAIRFAPSEASTVEVTDGDLSSSPAEFQANHLVGQAFKHKHKIGWGCGPPSPVSEVYQSHIFIIT